MTALLSTAWARASGWLTAVGAALALLTTAYAVGRRDGRSLSETETLRRALRAREMRDEVDRDVDRAGDPAGELRRDWRRP